MGLSFSKDKNIDIYMQTNKEYYFSGERIEGEIYLNVKQPRVYNRLLIKILGQEYVSWEEGSGESSTSYYNKSKSYFAECLIRNFNGQVEQGQYTFPFSLLLPAMITGSFYYSGFSYLKYTLRAELEHPSNASDSQYHQFFLNIIEAPHFNIGQTQVKNHVNSQCCKCCTDYGITSVTLKSDKNFVINGDIIKLTCIIDNSGGKQKIKRYNVVLQQHIFMTANGTMKNNIINKYNLVSSNQSTRQGEAKTFTHSCQIPASITSYTAIGNIIARYFVLHLQTQYGCCANTAQALLHIMVHSRRPQIVQKKRIATPQNWNPRIQQPVICNNLPPYIHSPQLPIPFTNSPSNQSISNLNMNGYSQFDSSNNINSFEAYQPTYYNQNMFSQAQRQQQGYQPYFNN